MSATAITSLSFSSAKAALKTGLDAIRGGHATFDLGSIAQADSSGIAVMLAWQRAAKATGVPLAFINVPDSILSLASLYGVTTLLGLPQPVASR
ncbi:MAG: STAS domain-containing protein [Alistipes senegalensis]|nr:STAS domain-containing protein [Oxalobacter formigenes]MCM1281621.1 STAS domain-containing protein [Alistipes senegalensis]